MLNAGKLFLIFIALSATINVNAQYHRLKDFGQRNGIYLELQIKNYDFSPSFASLNYERYYGRFKTVSTRFGVYITDQPIVVLPVEVGYIGNTRGKHQYEIGFGGFMRAQFTDRFKFDLPAMLFPIAYRYQESDKFYVRMGINFVAGNTSYAKPFFSLGHRF